MSGIHRHPGWVRTSDGKCTDKDGDAYLDGVNDNGGSNRIHDGPNILISQ
jgi:hypothetical protein